MVKQLLGKSHLESESEYSESAAKEMKLAVVSGSKNYRLQPPPLPTIGVRLSACIYKNDRSVPLSVILLFEPLDNFLAHRTQIEQ